MHQTSTHRRSRQETGSNSFTLTSHARRRLNGRGIPAEAVDVVLRYGRTVHTRGAAIRVIGRKEVFENGHLNLSPFEGIQVVCSPDGEVMTIYRNKDLRGLRSRRRRPSHRRFGR